MENSIKTNNEFTEKTINGLTYLRAPEGYKTVVVCNTGMHFGMGEHLDGFVFNVSNNATKEQILDKATQIYNGEDEEGNLYDFEAIYESWGYETRFRKGENAVEQYFSEDEEDKIISVIRYNILITIEELEEE